ncbi:uncharacterized protein LOC122573374 isoform X2 [Bombus pyrosoma]|uniref:uncharacterized protein LOC122573374 isoform X2 n=1 Tax=Bombus pyrosoma TaxID=396416 RepID=UPI001CB8F3C1|nr:uncharacterized protein LOC122573374 isoform X2 [Bombus pyrosoma]
MTDNIESKATVASEEIEAEECQEDVPEEGKIIRKDEKSRLNVEVLDDAETVTLEQPVYQIRPQLHEKFKPLNAKEVIHNVLFDQLSAKTYDAQEAAQWTKDIADLIREKVKGYDILCGHCVRRVFLLENTYTHLYYTYL